MSAVDFNRNIASGSLDDGFAPGVPGYMSDRARALLGDDATTAEVNRFIFDNADQPDGFWLASSDDLQFRRLPLVGQLPNVRPLGGRPVVRSQSSPECLKMYLPRRSSHTHSETPRAEPKRIPRHRQVYTRLAELHKAPAAVAAAARAEGDSFLASLRPGDLIEVNLRSISQQSHWSSHLLERDTRPVQSEARSRRRGNAGCIECGQCYNVDAYGEPIAVPPNRNTGPFVCTVCGRCGACAHNVACDFGPGDRVRLLADEAAVRNAFRELGDDYVRASEQQWDDTFKPMLGHIFTVVPHEDSRFVVALSEGGQRPVRYFPRGTVSLAAPRFVIAC